VVSTEVFSTVVAFEGQVLIDATDSATRQSGVTLKLL